MEYRPQPVLACRRILPGPPNSGCFPTDRRRPICVLRRGLHSVRIFSICSRKETRWRISRRYETIFIEALLSHPAFPMTSAISEHSLMADSLSRFESASPREALPIAAPPIRRRRQLLRRPERTSSALRSSLQERSGVSSSARRRFGLKRVSVIACARLYTSSHDLPSGHIIFLWRYNIVSMESSTTCALPCEACDATGGSRSRPSLPWR